jgi:hypothetical protein
MYGVPEVLANKLAPVMKSRITGHDPGPLELPSHYTSISAATMIDAF